MMDTHALSIFNQVGGDVPPVQRIGPPIQPIFHPGTMPPVKKIKYEPTGEFHPIAMLAGQIHTLVLDFLLKLHTVGLPPFARNFRQQFGKQPSGITIY